MKDIAYGYWWNCEHCGEENAYGLTDEEAEAYALNGKRKIPKC